MSASSTPQTPETDTQSEKLPFKEKMAVGAGGLTQFLANVGVNSTAIPFYQMTLGLNPALLGMMLAIPGFWDAFTDPVMGNISDNFHSRFGRRRPFIFPPGSAVRPTILPGHIGKHLHGWECRNWYVVIGY
jgi:hypothetical protein